MAVNMQRWEKLTCTQQVEWSWEQLHVAPTCISFRNAVLQPEMSVVGEKPAMSKIINYESPVIMVWLVQIVFLSHGKNYYLPTR